MVNCPKLFFKFKVLHYIPTFNISLKKFYSTSLVIYNFIHVPGNIFTGWVTSLVI